MIVVVKYPEKKQVEKSADLRYAVLTSITKSPTALFKYYDRAVDYAHRHTGCFAIDLETGEHLT